MNKTPRSLRLQIGIFGRTNTGKSSFLNCVVNQDAALTSEIPGTTTDVVEKSMELLPIGPVTFLDTAGLNDTTELSKGRLSKTMAILDRADIAVLIIEPDTWTEFEENLVNLFTERKIPYTIIINKTDLATTSDDFIRKLEDLSAQFLHFSSISENSNEQIEKFKKLIAGILPEGFSVQQPLIGDLLPPGGLCVMIVPIDKEAPKGRLIMPQVQALRDTLDSNAMSLVVKENEYLTALQKLKDKPDLVVCDSQVVDRMVRETPPDVPCTTFSILFCRYKGDLEEELRGLKAIDNLQPGDKVLIAEACSHHPNEDDIGRVKIPTWLRKYLGFQININVFSGRDYPEDLSQYKLIIHCGACMLTRNEKLIRIDKARKAGVPITNYGLLISKMKGVLERVLSPFKPDA